MASTCFFGIEGKKQVSAAPLFKNNAPIELAPAERTP
jgi:hypothetical protein